MRSAFNARFISTFTPDRLYRVHVERGEIFFIRIGGQAGVAEGVAAQFGLLGALLLRSFKNRADEKLASRANDVDVKHPSTQLSAHKHNFHTTAGAIQSSSLEPAATVGTHGEHFGRWKLKFRDGKEMLFQLETFEEMRKACEVLPSLGSVHASNVVYDPLKRTFARPAAEMAGART